MPVISVSDLCKQYRPSWFGRRKVAALKGVSLEVEGGQIFGLLGPNGAGKTTLIKILLGIVRKTEGSATVLGEPAGNRGSRQKIGYLPENHRIPRHLTGNTALEYYGALSGMSLQEVRHRREPLLATVGLLGRERDCVATYSKGMLQRLGLAQAMLHNPELIILDEPTDGVDPVGRAEIRKVLHQLKGEGKTIFLNSHLLQEVELVSDRVAIMDRGHVITSGSVQELTQNRDHFQFRVSGSQSQLSQALNNLPVQEISRVGTDEFEFWIHLPQIEAVDAVVDRLREQGLGLRGLSPRRSSLEEAFIKIVQQGEF